MIYVTTVQTTLDAFTFCLHIGLGLLGARQRSCPAVSSLLLSHVRLSYGVWRGQDWRRDRPGGSTDWLHEMESSDTVLGMLMARSKSADPRYVPSTRSPVNH